VERTSRKPGGNGPSKGGAFDDPAPF
jgi:hypothetical protein